MLDHLTHAADARCEGCDQPAHDVGVLAPVRLTYTDGTTIRVDYCEDCLHRATLAVEHPGEGYGAAALPSGFAKVERIVPRVADTVPCGMSEAEMLAEYAAHAASMVSDAEMMPAPRLWSSR